MNSPWKHSPFFESSSHRFLHQGRLERRHFFQGLRDRRQLVAADGPTLLPGGRLAVAGLGQVLRISPDSWTSQGLGPPTWIKNLKKKIRRWWQAVPGASQVPLLLN